MLLHHFLTSLDICDLATSQMIVSGAIIALANYFTPCKTSLSFVIGTIDKSSIYDKELSTRMASTRLVSFASCKECVHIEVMLEVFISKNSIISAIISG